MQQQRARRASLEARLLKNFDATVRELRERGTTEALLTLAESLTAYTRRSRLKELGFAVIAGLYFTVLLLGWINLPTFLVGSIVLGTIFWGPVSNQLNPTRAALLRAAIALLDGLTRTDLAGLLALLHALERGRPDSSNLERRVRFAALRLLGKNLIQTPEAELDQLTVEYRRLLGRELGRLLQAPVGQADLDVELPIRLFDERLQEAAREYKASLDP